MPLGQILAGLVNATSTTTTTSSTAVQAGLSPVVAVNSTTTQGLVPSLQDWVNSFAANAAAVTATMDNAALDLGKAAVVFLIIAGVILWFTRVNKRLGKDLLEGGVVIGLFIQFVVPFLLTIHFP